MDHDSQFVVDEIDPRDVDPRNGEVDSSSDGRGGRGRKSRGGRGGRNRGGRGGRDRNDGRSDFAAKTAEDRWNNPELTVAGTTILTILLITIKTNESQRRIPVIARNVHAVAVVAEVADAIVMKDKETINAMPKKFRAAAAMTRGAIRMVIRMAIAMTIVAAVTDHAMSPAAQMETNDLETNDLVEVAIVAHAEKTIHATSVRLVVIDRLATRATTAVGVAEAIGPNVMSVRNVQGVVVAVAVDHVDRMIQFRRFHDTAKCQLGTMRSQA